MREQLKKATAIILSVVMVMTLILVPENRIVAATNIPVQGQIEIPEGVTSDSFYSVMGAGELTVNGTVTSSISIQDVGKVIVGSTGEVQVSSGNAISISDSGSLKNSGKIGSVNSSSSVENTTEGEIEQITLAGGELSNSGKVTSIAALETTINNSGTIGSIEAQTTNVENSGTITTFKVRDANDTLTMTATSRITNLHCTSGMSPKLTIIATEGAKVGNADINMNYLVSSSSGSVTITDSLKMSEIYGATPDIPAGLKFNVESGTKITKASETDKWYVYYGGKKYLFPTTAFSDKTISDIYNITLSTDTIALDDLTVGYTAAETATDTFTISNTGIGKMGWKIVSIPEFIELYNEDGTQIADGYTVTLAGGESRTITIIAKTGKGADKYNGSISSQIWTAEAATASDNTLMSEPNINISLNVNKKPGSGKLTVDNVYYGDTVTYIASSTTNDGDKTVEFKKQGASNDTYSTELPTEAGEYTARATFAETDIYEEYVTTADFAILRKDGVGTVSVADIHYGQQVTPVVTSETNGTDNVTYKYKVKGSNDTTYTETKPTNVGAYTVQATFAQTDVYNEVIATADFNILRISGTGAITIPDIIYGEDLIPTVSSSTNGTDNVTYKYKVKGSNDTTYSETKPTNVGAYTVQATFAQTDVYNEVIVTADFNILRASGTGAITISDIIYGEDLIPTVSSSTNGTDNVTIEYKEKGANDMTYTQTSPVNPGEYTARATFAQTDMYNEIVVTTDFAITYLEAPESSYSISGNQGENDYYSSEVTILPAEGYLIADSLDGTYKKSLTISKSSDAFDIYLKKILTGQKTAGINVPAIKIDAFAPVILNVPSEGKIYGQQSIITIKDDNLSQVLVNGEQVDFTDNKAVLTLSSNLGEETYDIVCIDIAGNTINKIIIVAADWMKDRTIPSGAKVRLTEDYSYQLGSGTWQVEGDSTTYAGDSTFYVNDDGEYTFTKVE